MLVKAAQRNAAEVRGFLAGEQVGSEDHAAAFPHRLARLGTNELSAGRSFEQGIDLLLRWLAKNYRGLRVDQRSAIFFLSEFLQHVDPYLSALDITVTRRYAATAAQFCIRRIEAFSPEHVIATELSALLSEGGLHAKAPARVVSAQCTDSEASQPASDH